MTKKVKVAMIGLGFGAEFIPIYQRHPHAEVVAVTAPLGRQAIRRIPSRR